MHRLQPVPIRTLTAIAVLLCFQTKLAIATEPIQFSLQIRPILAEHCFHCHGPDESHREAGLRLDTSEGALSVLNGHSAIVPGNIEASELWKRIVSQDPETVMPPPSTHKPIKPAQQLLLRAWIEQGAAWGEHWSFELPLRKALPKFDASSEWASTSPIDAWTLAKMQSVGLQPAPAADANTLSRRLHLDLIGIPPTPQRVQRFKEDYLAAPKQAVATLIDELLDRPEFGEHWARMWLDLARYADTKGYEKDLGRDMWPYRDWVIDAINRDMPLDQFTTEQLAGDLLPQATESQRVATAFHRATLANDEGGTDDEEFRVAAVKDRVDTTMQVWMGLTMGCAKCHSHKYDPISIDDYYRFYAIFNQTEDADRYDDEPKLPLPQFAQQQRLLETEAKRLLLVTDVRKNREASFNTESVRWTLPSVLKSSSEQGAALATLKDRSIIVSGKRPEKDTYTIDLELPAGTYSLLRLEALTTVGDLLPFEGNPATPEVAGRNPSDTNFVLSELTLQTTQSVDGKTMLGPLVDFTSSKASFEQKDWPIANAFDGKDETGWAIGEKKNEPNWALLSLKIPIVVDTPTTYQLKLSQQFGGGLVMQRVRISLADRKLEEALPVESADLIQSKKRLADFDTELQKMRDAIPKLPIIRELSSDKQRVTKIHNRGSFLDQTTEVEARILSRFTSAPSVVPTKPTRLTAAQWLTSPNNPLTARVTANRVWAQLFGRGIVETEEDFGSQGSLPSHPELLDALAIDYQENFHWSLKKLLKQIVSSNTYQQSFVMDVLRKTKDPKNIYLSRGARQRLSAESVRDNALAIAGLLTSKRGGPPVMPPQPDGLWRSTYSGARWITSEGVDRYRRGIYTYWKRTSPYPSMETFDSSTREVCQIRRITTNTPLQALVTLNDPVYIEASNAFAQRLLREQSSTASRIDWAMQLATGRPAIQAEIDRLSLLLDKAQAIFIKDPELAKQALVHCHFERNMVDGKVIASDTGLAAWSIVTSAILNLDETLTK
jgi:hypothetical protein